MVEFKNTVLIPIDISAELTKDAKLMAIIGNGKQLIWFEKDFRKTCFRL